MPRTSPNEPKVLLRLAVCAHLAFGLAQAAPQRIAPSPTLVALLDASPGTDDAWAVTLTQASGSPAGLVRALAALQDGADRGSIGFGRRWSDRERDALHGALGRCSRSERSRALEEVAREGRCAALAVLEAAAVHGGVDDLAAIEVALEQLARNTQRRAREGRALTPAETRAVGAALVRFLRGERLRSDALAQSFERIHPEARAAVLHGLAGEPGSVAFDFARQVLEATRASDVDTLALAVLTVSAPAVPPIERARAAPAVRPRLVAKEPNRLNAAIGAAVALGDVQAVPTLVVVLERREVGVQDRAAEALHALTGRALDQAAHDWRDWLHQEERWLSASHLLAGTLARGGEERALGAVREVAGRMLFKKERARLLELALEHRSPRVRSLAAEALGTFPGEVTLAALARHASADYDADVRAAAAASLARLTTL